MRLTRLKIHEFPGVVAGTELHFGDGFNVLLGKNGTGKTTLLRLITCVLRGSFEAADTPRGDVEWEVQAGERFTFRYRWRPSSEPSGNGRGELVEWAGSMEANGERLIARSDPELSEGFGEATPTLELQPVLSRQQLWWPFVIRQNTPVSAVQAHANAAYSPEHPGRFDEGLQTFRALTEDREVGAVDGLGDVALTVAQKPGWLQVDSASLPAWMKPSDLATAALDDAVEFADADAPWLRRVAEALDVQGLRVRMEIDTRTEDSAGRVRVQLKKPEFQVQLDERVRVHHDHLSFGQKRMLAFMWYAACAPEGPLVVDELVNGLHHAWIRRCLDEIGSRQAFLASQNPLILDELPIGTSEEVQRLFFHCGLSEPDKRFLWRNFTVEEAVEFTEAYEVGIQHVSDILRTHDLW